MGLSFHGDFAPLGRLVSKMERRTCPDLFGIVESEVSFNDEVPN